MRSPETQLGSLVYTSVLLSEIKHLDQTALQGPLELQLAPASPERLLPIRPLAVLLIIQLVFIQRLPHAWRFPGRGHCTSGDHGQVGDTGDGS